MKLIFNKINTSQDSIGISLDGGKTWTYQDKSTLLEDGYHFTSSDCEDITLLRLKAGAKTFGDISMTYVPESFVKISFVDELPDGIEETPISGVLYIVGQNSFVWNDSNSEWRRLNCFDLSSSYTEGDPLKISYDSNTSTITIDTNYATIDDFDLSFVRV